MFSEYEAAPASLSGEFTRALRLLHSSEAGSAEELRGLLLASIAKRYGSERTGLSRFSELDGIEEVTESLQRDPLESPSTALDLFTDWAGNNVGDKDEVPRISIPDEGPNNEALCKVCNLSEFGPLILVQCQECKELYHPLCHQPPIIDADIHDPDFLWRCTDCQRMTWPQNISTRDQFFHNSSWIPGDGVMHLSEKLKKYT